MTHKTPIPNTITESDELLCYVFQLSLDEFPSIDYDEDGVPYVFGTEAPRIFADRYTNKKLDLKFTYQEYQASEEIQNTTVALGLDANKFWFLLLFIYDYCTCTCYQGYEKSESGKEQLMKFIDAIDSIVEENKIKSDIEAESFHLTKEAKITLSIKGKHSIVIDNPMAIIYTAIFCNNGVECLDPDSFMKAAIVEREQLSQFESDEVLIWHFATLFRKFFDLHLKDNKRQKKGGLVSYSKTLLVSKLIYFTRLSKNEKFQVDEYKLKDILKRHKNDKIKQTNSIYFY